MDVPSRAMSRRLTEVIAHGGSTAVQAGRRPPMGERMAVARVAGRPGFRVGRSRAAAVAPVDAARTAEHRIPPPPAR